MSAVDSDESLGRCQALLDHPRFSQGINHSQSHQMAVELDKAANTTAAGRSLREPQGRAGKKLFGGVLRYSDAGEPYGMLKEQQAEEREQVRLGSPFKGMTEFQTVIMARSASPKKRAGGTLGPNQGRSQSRSNSREPRRTGSPGRRGQAPS